MGLAVYAKLYQGADHYLQVSSTGFTESYKRFYFRDIQAIILERKRGRLWWSLLFALLVYLFAAAATVSSYLAAAFHWTTASVFFIALVVNWALGPACACYIRTAVQTERLRTLTRLRTGRAFIRRTAELVGAHQPQWAEPIGDDGGTVSFPPTEAPPASGAIS